MRRFSPLTLLSIGLVSLTVSIMLAGDALVGLIPNEHQQVFRQRKALSETLAIQYSFLVERGDLATLQTALRALVERNAEVESAALITGDGQMLAQAGLPMRPEDWSMSAASTLTRLHVPIYHGAHPWGGLHLLFRETDRLSARALGAWLSQAWLRFMLFVAAAGFVAYRVLMKRVLRHLDPSAVVPPRVKAALDTLTEGVAMLDLEGLIVLANEAFLKRVEHPLAVVLGHPLSRLPWMTAEGLECRQGIELPWHRALKQGVPQADKRLDLLAPSGVRVFFVVTASPILDDHGKLRGVIVAFHDVTELEKKNNELARTVTELVMAQVELTKKTEELHHLATRDPLTGCLNRRAFFEQVELVMADRPRISAGWGCVMIDIDHFKSFNDRYGHAVGDQVLTAVARTVNGSIRAEDIFGRYGGEEFCLVLAGVSGDVVLKTAERIRAKIDGESGAAVRSSAGLHVTASLGIVYVSGPADIHGLLGQADQALYFAKQNGRNQVARYDRQRGAPEPVASAGLDHAA